MTDTALSSQEAAHTRVSTHSECGLGVGAQALGVQSLGKGQELTAMKILWWGNVTLQRQTRENPGTAREAKDCFHDKTLTPLSNSTYSQNTGPCPRECWKRVRQLWSMVPVEEKQALTPEAEGRGALYDPPQTVVTSHRRKLRQALSTHSSGVYCTLTLPSTTEQVGPSNSYFYLSVLCPDTGEKLTEIDPKSKQNTGGCLSKGKQGKAASKWEEQWFTFLQLAWDYVL